MDYHFGNPAICFDAVTRKPWDLSSNRPVAFRPTLTDGLAFRFDLEQIRGGLEEKAMVLRRHDGDFSVLTPIS